MTPIANAPVSYGAFELTVGIMPGVPDGDAVLDAVAGAGYAGIDLGPVGYLGTGPTLAENLRRRSLGLAGGYVEMPFYDPSLMAGAEDELDAVLTAFEAAAPVNAELGLPGPRPTIAVFGEHRRRAVPGRAATDRSLGLSEQQWVTFGEQADRIARRCRERGFEPVFHNESGSSVEAPWEFAEVLARSTFDLCLDTGHLLVGGGDPVTFYRSHAARISHLHLKSAFIAQIEELVRSGAGVEAIWDLRVFCRLGDGDLDLHGLVSALTEHRYDGWLVVEQDIFPTSDSLASAADDQRENLTVLTQALRSGT